MTKDKKHKVGEYIPMPEEEPVGWAEHGVINWLADKQFNHSSFLYSTPSKFWMPKIEQQFKDGVLISQTIQYTPQGEKELYPKKQWIGLTADEIESLYRLATYMDETDYIHLLMLAEDKLKEKNA